MHRRRTGLVFACFSPQNTQKNEGSRILPEFCFPRKKRLTISFSRVAFEPLTRAARRGHERASARPAASTSRARRSGAPPRPRGSSAPRIARPRVRVLRQRALRRRAQDLEDRRRFHSAPRHRGITCTSVTRTCLVGRPPSAAAAPSRRMGGRRARGASSLSRET